VSERQKNKVASKATLKKFENYLFYHAFETVVFELNVYFDHIVNAVFDKIREDDIRFVARRKRISRA
ncbi:hypothetical protein, partial [Klebsiella pneumoniae]|uniref:hypothetical protein n=1 Tax=Klebsiella pneumoniae TaxID=573 RepID=UPI0025A056C4